MATFTFAFDGTHSPPKAAGANLQLLCRLLDLGVSSLAPSSASASLQLPAPGAHRGWGPRSPEQGVQQQGASCSARWVGMLCSTVQSSEPWVEKPGG